MLNDEIRYKLLKALDHDPNLTQRQMAQSMKISLGKVNYCISALLEIGLIKSGSFRRSKNKLGYAYILTSKGMEEKKLVTKLFLQKKMQEHAEIEKEIENIRIDMSR